METEEYVDSESSEAESSSEGSGEWLHRQCKCVWQPIFSLYPFSDRRRLVRNSSNGMPSGYDWSGAAVLSSTKSVRFSNRVWAPDSWDLFFRLVSFRREPLRWSGNLRKSYAKELLIISTDWNFWKKLQPCDCRFLVSSKSEVKSCFWLLTRELKFRPKATTTAPEGQ